MDTIPPEFFRPDTPLFKVLLVEPQEGRPGRYIYLYRNHRGLLSTYTDAPDELGAFAKAQASLDALRKEQLGRRMKAEAKDDNW